MIVGMNRNLKHASSYFLKLFFSLSRRERWGRHKKMNFTTLVCLLPTPTNNKKTCRHQFQTFEPTHPHFGLNESWPNSNMVFDATTFVLFFGTQKARATRLVFRQVERRFYGRESNRQLLHLVLDTSLHYHPVV